MVQLQSYGFTTVENPLSDGGNFTNFSTFTGAGGVKVPSSGVCEPVATNTNAGALWTGSVVQSGGTWPADHYSEITLLSAIGAGNYDIARVRQQSATVNTAYECNIQGNNGSAVLYSVVAGTATEIGSALGQTISPGDVWRVTASGTTISVTQNGTSKISVTSSTISGGSPAFKLYDSVLTNSQISLWAGGGNQAATPTFSQTGPTLTISSTTSGGTIYYTTDGSTPTHSSSFIPNGGTIAVLGGQTVKAFESATNFGDSAIGTYMVTSSGAGGGTTNDPWLSPWISNSLRGVEH